MVQVECSRSVERLWFEGREEPDPPQPLGTLAAAVLATFKLDARERTMAARRLVRWALDVRRPSLNVTRHYAVSFGSKPVRRATPADAHSLGLIAEQLGVWFQIGQIRWDAATIARVQTLSVDVEWRGPDAVRVTSPEAAVLVSAINGVTRGTLVGCLKCGRLATVSGGAAKRRQCSYCGTLRRSASQSVIREYKLAYDRMRKTYPDPCQTRTSLSAALLAIRAENRAGTLSTDSAIARIIATIPIGTRGAPRRKKSN